MKKAIIFLILSLVPLSCLISAKKKETPVTMPEAYILIESKTRTVLDERNSDMRLNAGYMSKLMTLLLTAENIENGKFSLDTELSASESVRGMKGSVVWLEPGDKMTVNELIKSVAVGNANDAALVLAESSAGTAEAFVMEMNREAFELGALDTAYFSPFGYYDEREYTTAHDLALVCAKLYEFDFMREYFAIWRDFVRDGNVELVNENTLSRTYKLHAGFKACHSDQTGFCIAECGCNEKGSAFIAIVLGAESEEVSFGMAKQLIGSGFSDYKVTDAYFPEDLIPPVSVKHGESPAVELTADTQQDVVVPKGADKLRFVSVIPKYLTAPLKKGDAVGTVAVYNKKELLYEADIVVKNDVKELTFRYVFRKILSNIIE